eukprot:SM008699S23425  [mRNA]  locus=s8699:50:379:+ [translate_table: standard]
MGPSSRWRTRAGLGTTTWARRWLARCRWGKTAPRRRRAASMPSSSVAPPSPSPVATLSAGPALEPRTLSLRIGKLPTPTPPPPPSSPPPSRSCGAWPWL